MLDSKVLRVGNTVLAKDGFKTVDVQTLVDITNNREEYYGIPLSKEMLSKLNMPTKKTDNWKYWFEPDGKWLVEDVKNDAVENNYLTQCHFLHQLQNIIYDLEGKEITFVKE